MMTKLNYLEAFLMPFEPVAKPFFPFLAPAEALAGAYKYDL